MSEKSVENSGGNLEALFRFLAHSSQYLIKRAKKWVKIAQKPDFTHSLVKKKREIQIIINIFYVSSYQTINISTNLKYI